MSKKLTMREAIQALLDGKKLTTEYWGRDEYILLENSIVNKEEQLTRLSPFNEYILYEPPKQKKKVTLYKYLILDKDDNVIDETIWTSRTFDEFSKGEVLLKTESKEVEYEEQGDE